MGKGVQKNKITKQVKDVAIQETSDTLTTHPNEWSIKTVSLYMGVCLGFLLFLGLFIWGLYEFYRWIFPGPNNEQRSGEEKISRIIGDMEEKLTKTINDVKEEYEDKIRKMEEEIRASLKQKYEEAMHT